LATIVTPPTAAKTVCGAKARPAALMRLPSKKSVMPTSLRKLE
jgi:hypothetical protein